MDDEASDNVARAIIDRMGEENACTGFKLKLDTVYISAFIYTESGEYK